ncbi:hypothetical protein CYY_002435 [Polysphondylium violaceum]|uniref:NADH dehydrogenase n=1 Tax=Polysphondylium violaceum TaxID=133409 RepID=A0A8J4Q1A0_9MYCE|nr:hypothetical protein CYY_002435 [Polysphondylium violaceum]
MASNIAAIKLMRPALVSATTDAAHRRTLKLYRNCIRSIPYLIQHFNLSYNMSDMRKRIRDDFVQYREVKEKNQIDRLAFIGETELFDAMSLLKTRSHVVNYFETKLAEETENETEQLLKKFFE